MDKIGLSQKNNSKYRSSNMKIGEHIYKLVLLDTNAIREIVMNVQFAGKGFFETFFNNTTIYAPCFSIYNVIELTPYEDIFEKFLEFFSLIPCFVTFPAKNIFQEEYNCSISGKVFKINNQVAYALNPLATDKNSNCRNFFSAFLDNKSLMNTIHNEVEQFSSIANEWEQKRNDSVRMLNQMQSPFNIINDKFYKTQEKESIIKDLRNFGISTTSSTDTTKLPAARIMEYSQFMRIYLTKKKIRPNDVMDICISSITPYVDAVITESFQADVYKKSKNFIPQMQKLKLYTLKDIRINET